MDHDCPPRNLTLPVKNKCRSGSGSKIKISSKGLPRDFFHPHLQYRLKSSKIGCQTQHTHNQFQQTSYFQTLTTPQPKRQGRQYKSQQRKRPSKKRLHQNEDALKNKPNDSFIMNCTFFKGREGDETVSSKQTKSYKMGNKVYTQQSSNSNKPLQISTSKEELSNIFKARGGMFQLNFHRLNVNGNRGPLPLIRLNKRMIV